MIYAGMDEIISPASMEKAANYVLLGGS